MDNEVLNAPRYGSAVTFQVVLTKADKVKAKDREMPSLHRFEAALQAKHVAAFPEIVVTSSESGDGIDTLRADDRNPRLSQAV